MSKTEVSGKQVKDGTIDTVDLSSSLQSTISGKAESADVTALDTRVTAVESDVAALQSASAPNLSDLGEVSITSPSSGQVLKYNGTGWANAADSTFSGSYTDLTNKPTLFSGSYTDLTNKPTIPSALDDLSDVTISSPSNDQVLKYNGTAWVNSAAPAAGATDLDGLSDVAVTSAAKGQFIVHDGTQFVNSNTIEASGAAVKPLIVKGAASQTANLLEVQNSSATALLAVDSSGKLGIGTSSPTYNLDVSGSVDAHVTGRLVNSNAGTSAGSQLIFGNNANAVGVCLFSNSSTSTAIGGAGSFNIYQAQNAPIITYTSGTERMRLDGSGQLGIGAASPGAQLHVVSGAAARKGLIVKGAASQTANLFEAQNSSGTALASVSSNGKLVAAGGDGNEPALAITGLFGKTGFTPTALTQTGIYCGNYELGAGDYQNIIKLVSSNAAAIGVIDFQSTGAATWNTYRQRLLGQTAGGLELYTSNSANTDRNVVAEFGGWSNTKPSLRLTARSAAAQGLIVQGAASQTANLIEVQNSSGTVGFSVTAAGEITFAGGYVLGKRSTTRSVYIGTRAGQTAASLEDNVAIGHDALNAAAGNGTGENVAIGKDCLMGSVGSYAGNRNTGVGFQAGQSISSGTNNTFIGYRAGPGITTGSNNVFLGSSSGGAATSSNQIAIGNTAGTSGTEAIAIGTSASAAANCLDLRFGGATRISGDSSGNITIAQTLHAKRYTETVANAFNTSLAPSSGTLTVDTSVGNCVLGALSASVTTWAFTNVPTDNSKVTTVTAVLAGNASYTYGDACSVNGSSVTDGIMWSGGSAPTATSGTDIITFVIVKDSAGTVKVFGSATTNFS